MNASTAATDTHNPTLDNRSTCSATTAFSVCETGTVAVATPRPAMNAVHYFLRRRDGTIASQSEQLHRNARREDHGVLSRQQLGKVEVKKAPQVTLRGSGCISQEEERDTGTAEFRCLRSLAGLRRGLRGVDRVGGRGAHARIGQAHDLLRRLLELVERGGRC